MALQSPSRLNFDNDGKPVDPRSGRQSDAEAFLIGQVGRMLCVQPQTIRFYERMGLVTPRKLGRLRIYSGHDLKKLQLVRYLRELDVPLQSIRNLFANSAAEHSISLDSLEIRKFLGTHLEAMKQAQSNLASRIAELSARLCQSSH